MSQGRPFEPGNKFGRGRPPGSKNKSTSAAGWQLLREHELSLRRKDIAEGLTTSTKSRHHCFDELREGEPRASKLRLLLPIKTLEDIAKNLDLVLEAVALRKCTYAYGQAVQKMILDRVGLAEAALAARVEQLEALVKKPGGSGGQA